MPWDNQDDLDFILSESPEELEAKKAVAEDPHGMRMRSSADDILDAVEGQSIRPKDITLCPLCKGPTKKRGPGVGAGLQSRKCRKCGHEYPTGMVANRAAVRQTMVRVPRAGPYFGEGGPPIDQNQPVQRRIAEHIRRIKDNEP